MSTIIRVIEVNTTMLGMFFQHLFVLLVLSGHSPNSTLEKLAGTALPFTNDGAWCWFQDPRAVYVSGQRRRTYAGWMTRSGQLQVGAYDHDSGNVEVVTIKEKWDVDDHNVSSFLVLADKRLMVFYARHNETGLFCRTTSKPEDISSWEREITVADTPRITYSHPVYLSAEKRFYVFWRGESWKPTFSASTDGVAWTAPQILIQDDRRTKGTVRPYLKLVSDGIAEIHFAFTDGHPEVEPENSLYYLKYKAGEFFKANDQRIGTVDSLPIQPRKSDRVYDARTTKIRSWVFDIALDESGNPVIVYSRIPDIRCHFYHYAVWKDDKWLDAEISPAGKWFPQTPTDTLEQEPYYSGGITMNHENPSVVYLSREIGPTFEIEKWTTGDYGKTWSSIAITGNSNSNNVRPVVPRGYDGKQDHLLWMKGDYIHYTKYHTGIWLLVPAGNPAH